MGSNSMMSRSVAGLFWSACAVFTMAGVARFEMTKRHLAGVSPARLAAIVAIPAPPSDDSLAMARDQARHNNPFHSNMANAHGEVESGEAAQRPVPSFVPASPF